MSKRLRIAKRLWVAALSVLGAALTFSFFAAVLLFANRDRLAIFPTVATFLMVGALIMLIFARRKALLAIGTCVAASIAYLALLITSETIGETEQTVTGYLPAVFGALTGAVAVNLCIPFMILAKIRAARPIPQIVIVKDPTAPAQSANSVAGGVEDLYDIGCAAEASNEDKVAEEIAPPVACRYRYHDTVIEIDGDAFTILYREHVVKSGRVERNEEGGSASLTLTDREGRQCFFAVKEDAIESGDGVRYDRV